MKKSNIFYNFIKKIKQSNIGVSLFVNLCFAVLIFSFCDSKYEVSDDFVMASILSGAYGDNPNPHMIFVNVILGYILMPLYYLFPQVSWYYVFQILVIFLSSVTITYLLLEWTENTSAKILSVLLITFFTSEAYILVQFTKTAIFAVMAGALIFTWALFNKKGRIRVLWGAALCLIGTWIRFDTIYIAGIFILLILIYEIAKLFAKKQERIKTWKRLFRILICGGSLILGAYAGKWIDEFVYTNDEAYYFFSKYNVARSRIVDRAIEDYSLYSEELEQLGVSENDFYMITTWSFADNEVFGLETMESIARVVKEKADDLRGGFTDILNNMQSREFLKYPVCLACLLLLILSIFLDLSKWWLLFGPLVGGGILLFYFSYRGRSVYRVEYAVFFAVFVGGLYFWENQNKLLDILRVDRDYIRKTGKSMLLLLCVGSIALYIPDREYKYVDSENRKEYIDNTFYTSWNYGAGKFRKVVNRNRPENGLLKEIETHQENFYFLDFNTTIQTLYYEWSPWETLPEGYYDNCLYLGGVTTNFPEANNILKKKGYSNPLKALVEDGVYLVDNKGIDLKVNFLREHYYPEARAELYKKIDGYQIWKLYVK